MSYSERFPTFGAQYFEFSVQYFLPSLSMSNHSSQLTLHTDSHVSDIGALRWEGRKILSAKYWKPFGIGHTFV
jgi:hypothetical protein